MSSEVKLVNARKFTIVVTARANIGYCALAKGEFRIMVEPSKQSRAKLRAVLSDWKPRIVKGFLVKDVAEKDLKKAVVAAIEAAGTEGQVSLSPHSPKWLRAALRNNIDQTDKRRRMVAAVKRLQLPGCNFASRWSTKSLLRHLS